MRSISEIAERIRDIDALLLESPDINEMLYNQLESERYTLKWVMEIFEVDPYKLVKMLLDEANK